MLIKKAMDTIDEMITGVDEQLPFLESEQTDRVPKNFLKRIYIIRRELGYITSWLLHTREGLDLITTEPSIIEIKEREKLSTLMDKCSKLSDNASATQTAFSDLSGYYPDSNGFQLNQVMKFLAVLTALKVTPAITGGLLGMNLIDQPWSATLPQIITVIGLVMLFTTWVYYRLGWFTR